MNVAKIAYKNLEMSKVKSTPKSGGLLARDVSDKTDTKYGKRMPFYYFGIALGTICYIPMIHRFWPN